MAAQLDFFEPSVTVAGSRPNRSKIVPTSEKPLPNLDDEAMARHLEDTGSYRVLRKLEPPQVTSYPRADFPRRGVIVDTETTGLNYRSDEIIEIGAVAFSFNDLGEIGEVTGVYGGLQQPTTPIPAEITRLTGITDDMVAGQIIDAPALRAIVGSADLIIAHNASFDRPFCEAFSPMFTDKAWACSVSEIDWAGRGFEGSKLGYLVASQAISTMATARLMIVSRSWKF